MPSLGVHKKNTDEEKTAHYLNFIRAAAHFEALISILTHHLRHQRKVAMKWADGAISVSAMPNILSLRVHKKE